MTGNAQRSMEILLVEDSPGDERCIRDSLSNVKESPVLHVVGWEGNMCFLI